MRKIANMKLNKLIKLALPIAFTICTSCQIWESHEECDISGYSPETWLPPEHRFVFKRKHAIDVIYNFSEYEPFNKYIGKELQLRNNVRLLRYHFEGGYLDYIEDVEKSSGQNQFESVRLVGVKGHFCYSPTPVYSRITALLKIKLKEYPKPIYAQYTLNSTSSKDKDLYYDASIKRAPWESKSTPEKRSLLDIMQTIDKQENQKSGLD